MEGSSDEREMEVEALQSIYGEQFSTGGGSANEPVIYEVKLEQNNTKIIFTIPGTVSFLQRYFKFKHLGSLISLRLFDTNHRNFSSVYYRLL